MRKIKLILLSFIFLLAACVNEKEEIKPDGTAYYNKLIQFNKLRIYTDAVTYSDSLISDWVVWESAQKNLGTKTRMYYHQKDIQKDWIQLKDSSTWFVQDWISNSDTVFMEPVSHKGLTIYNYHQVYLIK